MTRKPGRKVFTSQPREFEQPPQALPQTRTSLLHGSAKDVQPGAQLLRFVSAAAGSLVNGTVVAERAGKLVLEISTEGTRTLREIEVEKGRNFITGSTAVSRGDVILLQALTEFEQIDLSVEFVQNV